MKMYDKQRILRILDGKEQIRAFDMPLSFRSNVNMNALKSNVNNIKSKPTNKSFISSIKSNLASIQADREEWKDYYNKDVFDNYNNIKSICKKLCSEYIRILNSISDNDDIDSSLRREINRCILDLDGDMSNIFR